MRIVTYDPTADAHNDNDDATDVCVSFGGGAWRGAFYLGVMEELQTQFAADVLAHWAFCGSSAGACYALALAMGVPHARLKQLLCVAAAEARGRALGVAFCVNTITGRVIHDMLDSVEDSELIPRLRGRFAVCVTAVTGWSMEPRLLLDFESSQEIFEACCWSSNIPFFSSLCDLAPPLPDAARAVDGCFTPDGCVPLLPSRCVVYGRCHGAPARPLPGRVTWDLRPETYVSLRECFRTPASDDAVANMAAEGQRVAAAFFASERWASRYAIPHVRDTSGWSERACKLERLFNCPAPHVREGKEGSE